MRCAVVYQSKSGNTKMVAERIYESLWQDDTVLVDIDEDLCYPDADVFFIGFGIHDGNCSMDIIDYLENLPNVKYALFATCGYCPSNEYKDRLQGNLDVWLPDNGVYLGMFLCQGNIERDRRIIMIGKMPSREKQLKQLFEAGSTHPDDNDLHAAEKFAEMIRSKAEVD